MDKTKIDLRIVSLVSLCLIAVIIGVYIQVINFDFVGYDDELYVTKNYHVQKGVSIEGVKWAFTTIHAGNWHPLTWISHMIDCTLYGLNPAGHHWGNVELHIANSVLLFLVLFMMTKSLWKCVFVAALFALHPLHVESVAWVAERKDVLSTLMFLLTLAAYYRYVNISSYKTYLPVVICFCLGLMAKPMLVTLPFVLLLLDIWPLRRFQYKNDFRLKTDVEKNDIKRNYRLILEKIPLFVLVIISCILTFIAQKKGGAVKVLEALPLKDRISNALVSYVNYVLKTIWPHKLAVFYPHPGSELPEWQVIGATLLIVTACIFGIKALKKYPYVAVGLFWYLGTLVPVIGLLQVGSQAMADRYTYIPLIGIFIVTAWGSSDILKRWRYRKIFFRTSAAIILIALTWSTSLQLKNWKNGITLFEHAVNVTKSNFGAENNLGTAYSTKDLDKALIHYQAALKIKPDYVFALYNLATIYEKKGQIDDAINNYLKALQVKTDYFEALNNLGLIFYNKGNYERAVLYFKRALKSNSKKVNARINLANVLFLQSKPDEAIIQYQKILQTDPENADAHFNLAYVLFSQDKIDEAVYHYNETLRIDPKYSKAYYYLGNILLSRGKIKEALSYFAKAIQFKPDYAQVYHRLGLMLLKQGKLDKAKVFFLKAIRIDPNFSKAQKKLGILNQYSPTVEN